MIVLYLTMSCISYICKTKAFVSVLSCCTYVLCNTWYFYIFMQNIWYLCCLSALVLACICFVCPSHILMKCETQLHDGTQIYQCNPECEKTKQDTFGSALIFHRTYIYLVQIGGMGVIFGKIGWWSWLMKPAPHHHTIFHSQAHNLNRPS